MKQTIMFKKSPKLNELNENEEICDGRTFLWVTKKI